MARLHRPVYDLDCATDLTTIGTLMTSRLSLAIICGGCSVEHEISLRSADHVVNVLDCGRYDVSVLFISRQGDWYFFSRSSWQSGDIQRAISAGDATKVSPLLSSRSPAFIAIEGGAEITIDVAFPLVHGTQGENGELQGLFQLMRLPYVGSEVFSSALSMDKHHTKLRLQQEGIAVVPWKMYRDAPAAQSSYDILTQAFGMELFVKPSSLGSSIGISHVQDEASYKAAVELAFSVDETIIVEPAVFGREIECGVLNGEIITASLPGEIISANGFYDYNEKYAATSHAKTIVPAPLEAAIIDKIQALAVQVFQVVSARSLLRVDFFVTKNNIFVNEVNTMPGFTDISLFPKMWRASGVSDQALLGALVDRAYTTHSSYFEKRALSMTQNADVKTECSVVKG